MRFQEYTTEEFLEVSVHILKSREEIPEQLAIYLATKVNERLNTKDVRDSVKVARLLKEKTKEEVDEIINILVQQK